MKGPRRLGYVWIGAVALLALGGGDAVYSDLLSANRIARNTSALGTQPLGTDDASRLARHASAAAAQPLGAEGQAVLRDAVKAGQLAELRWPDFSDYRERVAKFYDTRGDSLRWVADMRPTAQALGVIKVLQAADEKGLAPEDYDGPRWNERLEKLKPTTAEPNEADAARFDLALTVSTMRYISDVQIGKVNPQHLDFRFNVADRRYDLPEFLTDHVIHAADVAEVLEQVEPPYPGYQRTIRALKTYQELAREDSGEAFPDSKKPILPGNTYAGVPRLAEFLTRVGDLSTNTPDWSGNTYQGQLVEAVRHFQERHGLPADGHLDSRTIAELNVPLSRRVRQMQLILERWRWLPKDYQDSPVIANIPEFRLRAYDNEFRTMVTMNVVVGQAYRHETPIFVSKMRYVIFRPYWEVPPSIAQREILPAIQKKNGYMEKENLEFVDRKNNPVQTEGVDDSVEQKVRRGELFVRQKPGPKNSLGLAKFIFPNEFDIYMHDTPATELFAKSRRDFSHGCIRLERPADLAAWVLRDVPGWTPERIKAVMNGEQTEQVNLPHPIPVLIVYGTAIVREDGIVRFYDDIYGHDAELERALAHGYPYPS